MHMILLCFADEKEHIIRGCLFLRKKQRRPAEAGLTPQERHRTNGLVTRARILLMLHEGCLR